MCGVIGLIYEAPRPDLGRIAADLLRTLEYRGYDSTGGAFQGDGPEVRLRKGVGAPSAVVGKLGIVGEAGQIFCGQVRWATFGAVTDANAQPHDVRCKTHLYGAHNGNVTNCDALKTWLGSEGHLVRSDNDGEMVVHTVEHFFHVELSALPSERVTEREARRQCMRRALVRAAARLEGSYAAVVVDPVSRRVWAVKQGSSLYAGLGSDARTGRFAVTSSDLSAVLRMTRLLVPLSEGECLEHDAAGYQVFRVRDRAAGAGAGPVAAMAGEVLAREPVRSRLRAQDAALDPRFQTFMEQEIAAQEATCRRVATLFGGGSLASRLLSPIVDARPSADVAEIATRLDRLRDQRGDEALGREFRALVDAPSFRSLLSSMPADLKTRGSAGTVEALGAKLTSSEAGLLADLLPVARDADDLLAVRLLDVLLEREETQEFAAAVDSFVERCQASLASGGRIYIVCCGSSYHAAKMASVFFNEVARVQVHAVLPGEFRGEYARSLQDGDLFVAVSQSGETKDLLDVLNDVLATGLSIGRVAVVNNVNSTLAQEKADVVIPLRCGPEIAVPATKSFMNQLAVFYGLAVAVGARRFKQAIGPGGPDAAKASELERHRAALVRLPALVREALEVTEAATEEAAEALFLQPSLHVLATRMTALAMEGALKIREVVLNHAEGFEASEFKHGPNTLLGFNTVFGPLEVAAVVAAACDQAGEASAEAAARGATPDAVGDAARAVGRALFTVGEATSAATRGFAAAVDPTSAAAPGPVAAVGPARSAARSAGGPPVMGAHLDRAKVLGALEHSYPLVFVTGPDERDVALTVSQINTHKIRGAAVAVIAEESAALREAASKPPAGNAGYRWAYVALPKTGDNLLAAFTATVALQRLALKMSDRKARYLDGLGVAEHGVHPDVPKNVSKSITVD